MFALANSQPLVIPSFYQHLTFKMDKKPVLNIADLSFSSSSQIRKVQSCFFDATNGLLFFVNSLGESIIVCAYYYLCVCRALPGIVWISIIFFKYKTSV